MPIQENLTKIKSEIPSSVTLVVVTKTHPTEKLLEVYNAHHKIFGENKVQEMLDKYEQLPKDIDWHLIGHLQTNKVKFIAPFVKLIHSVDSLKLLIEINKQAQKNNRIIDCLLQIFIAQEETKFGLDETEAAELLNSDEVTKLPNIKIVGLMGMASNTNNTEQVKKEFQKLKFFFDKQKVMHPQLQILSMGMSGDYKMAIEQGSNMVRVGSAIFGSR